MTVQRVLMTRVLIKKGFSIENYSRTSSKEKQKERYLRRTETFPQGYVA
jgi:hypothetical protein